MEFSSKEYWSGLPFPSPGDLPNPGIESGSSTLQADSSLSHQGNPLINPMASNREQMTWWALWHREKAWIRALSSPLPRKRACSVAPHHSSSLGVICGRITKHSPVIQVGEEGGGEAKSSHLLLNYPKRQCFLGWYTIWCKYWVTFCFQYSVTRNNIHLPWGACVLSPDESYVGWQPPPLPSLPGNSAISLMFKKYRK